MLQYQRKPLRLSNGGSSHKKKATPSKTPNQNHHALPQKYVLKRDSKGKIVSPKHQLSTPMTHEEINEKYFEENLRKPKSEIQLPGWRRIESPYKSRISI